MEAGGIVVVEDPDRAYAREMPAAALRACPAAQVLPLDAIAPYLLTLGTA